MQASRHAHAPRTGIKVIHEHLVVDERGPWRAEDDGFWTWTCSDCGTKTAYLSPVARAGSRWRIVETYCPACV